MALVKPLETRIYQKFFRKHSIQRADRFVVSIIQQLPKITSSLADVVSDLETRTGPMPKIDEFQVDNVVIPNFSFRKEVFPQGNFGVTQPVLEYAGFEISVLFSENAQGSVSKFIEWAKRRVMDDRGVYYARSISRIGTLRVMVINDANSVEYAYDFESLYFLQSTPITFDYLSNQSQKISITFGADNVVFLENE